MLIKRKLLLRKMIRNKKGISGVIITILLILIAITTALIVWNVIKFIIEREGKTDISMITADAVMADIWITEDNLAMIKVKINPRQGNVSGIKFVFSNLTDEYVHTENYTLSELETHTFEINLTDKIENSVSIQIHLLFEQGQISPVKSTAEKQADGSWKISGDGKIEGEKPALKCNNDNECTADYYSNNYCDGNNVKRYFHNYSCVSESCIKLVSVELVESCGTGESCVNGICQACTDSCTSLNYECGTHIICNVSVDCGTCATGKTCVAGVCQLPSIDYIRVSGKEFYKGNRKFVPFGTNYYPANMDVIKEREGYYPFWTDYNKNIDLIERELAQMKSLGFNVIFVFSPVSSSNYYSYLFDYPTQGTENFRDFVRRASNHGLMVSFNQKDYCEPINIGWGQSGIEHEDFNAESCQIFLNEMYGQLPENLKKNVFAMDISIEPKYGNKTGRDSYNFFSPSAFENWAINKYGSVDNTLSVWGKSSFDTPKDEEFCTVQATTFVSDYKEFLRQAFSEKFQTAISTIHSWYPNLMISTRLRPIAIPYCTQVLPPASWIQQHLDFIMIEGYESGAYPDSSGNYPISTGEMTKCMNPVIENYILEEYNTCNKINLGEHDLPAKIGYALAYLDFGKPIVMWEFGFYLDGSTFRTPENQRHYYNKMYDTLLKYGATGALNWEYVQLINENEDYGIVDRIINPVNPVHNDKLVTPVIRTYSNLFKNSNTSGKQYNCYIEIDDTKYNAPHFYYVEGFIKYRNAILKKAGSGCENVVGDAIPRIRTAYHIDNLDPEFSATSGWTASNTIVGYYGTNYLVSAAGTGSNKARWSLNVDAGRYEVYARWASYSNRASNAPYTINYIGGSEIVRVNQQINGGQWNLLGTYEIDSSSYVELSNDANSWVIADAVKIVRIS